MFWKCDFLTRRATAMSRYLLISFVLLIFGFIYWMLTVTVTDCILPSVAQCNRLLLPIAPFHLCTVDLVHEDWSSYFVIKSIFTMLGQKNGLTKFHSLKRKQPATQMEGIGDHLLYTLWLLSLSVNQKFRYRSSLFLVSSPSSQLGWFQLIIPFTFHLAFKHHGCFSMIPDSNSFCLSGILVWHLRVLYPNLENAGLLIGAPILSKPSYCCCGSAWS